MMLQALYELAEREHLMSDPDYEPQAVPWLLRIGEGGRFLGFEDTRYELPAPEGKSGKKKKPKRVAKKFQVAREGRRTSGDRPLLFCDNANYLLKISPSGKRKNEKLQSRFDLFRDRANSVFEATEDEAVKAVCDFLESLEQEKMTIEDEIPEDLAETDLIGLVYGTEDRLIVQRPKVRSYWKEQRSDEIPTIKSTSGKTQNADGTGDGDFTCLVTGKRFSGSTLFPSIKKIPSQEGGVSLVSFNKSSFESYALDGNENAPISREAAEACATALNRLLDPQYPNPDNPNESLPKRHYRLSYDTVVVFWTREVKGDDFADSFCGLQEANPAQVRELYHSIWRGKPAPVEDDSTFYALTLTGQQGRAIVRDWLESTVKEVSQHLARHFADLAIVRNCPPPKERGRPPGFATTALLEAIAERAERRQEGIPAHFAAQIVHSALTGTPYPDAFLQRAVLRYRSEIGHENEDWKVKNWNDCRAAAIKAVLRRRPARSEDKNFDKTEVKEEMDPTCTADGYALGQLMAIFERLQQLALKDVNASVVDRFFSGASAAPRSTFGRLHKNARHHARKAREESGQRGMVLNLERLIDELSDRFDPKSNGWPLSLSLDQQGLFILGFHQMRKFLWLSREERERWEREHPDAPAAYRWLSRSRNGAETANNPTTV